MIRNWYNDTIRSRILHSKPKWHSAEDGESQPDNIQAELVQAEGEAMIDILTSICNKIWKTGEWPTTGLNP